MLFKSRDITLLNEGALFKALKDEGIIKNAEDLFSNFDKVKCKLLVDGEALEQFDQKKIKEIVKEYTKVKYPVI